MQHARERIVSSSGEPSGFEVLQHSSTYCAGVDGSSTAVIALLKQQNILEVCPRHSSCTKPGACPRALHNACKAAATC